jgi:GntR family transcriptional regulator
MTFNNEKPIYLQMAERLMDEIAAGIYPDEERIPSVREYAVSLGVNTNTAMKAYDELSRNNIIYNKRGLGYFVTPGANENIKQQRKKEFMEESIPQLLRQMKLIDMDVEQLTKLLHAQTADKK